MKNIFYGVNIIHLLIISSFAISSCTKHPEKPSASVGSDSAPDLDHTFLQYLTKQQEIQLSLTKSPGASIHVIKDSTIYFQHLYGVRDLQSNEPVTENTLFRLGSLSKGITGILAAKLHEKGILDLEVPVVNYLPCLSKKENEEVKKIKLRHLLSHSSGIVPHAYTLDLESGVSPIDLCHKYEQLISGSRRETHFYQNAFFSLIEHIIEKQTGRPFSQVMQEELFEPLGIRSAVFDHQSYVSAEEFAVPHRWNRSKKNYAKVAFKKKYYNAVSAGGISMSSADMNRWMEALLGNRKEVISENVLQLAFHKYIDTRNDPRNVNKWPGVDSVHYGLGWRIVDYRGKVLMYHAGYVDEYRSEILIDPADHIGIFAVFNCANSYASKVIPSLLQSLELKEEIQQSQTKEAESVSSR